jgi:hypothetical protein
MDYIKFYPEQIVVNNWNDDLEEWEEIPLNESGHSLSYYFRYLVIFDENLTVENFLRHLIPETLVLNTVFQSYLGGCPLEPFFQELEQEASEEPNEDIEYVEFYWATEIYDNEFDEYCSYHGIGKPDEEGFRTNWSFSFSPLSNWKHHRLVLNHEYVIEQYHFQGEGWDTKYQGKNTLFKGKKEFTLWDILSAFFFEISFFGSPENRDEKAAEIEQISEEYENGNMETITLEEVILEEMEKDLQTFIESEDYEEAEALKNQIKEYKTKHNLK